MVRDLNETFILTCIDLDAYFDRNTSTRAYVDRSWQKECVFYQCLLVHSKYNDNTFVYLNALQWMLIAVLDINLESVDLDYY